ncbi:MAG: hypothetical protein K0S76_1376 [Herbinix sp.]|jgi:hypothetical protein|nr:hypothetical protein [Herbinix sp.]
MKKNFFKKLSFVMALAMLVSVIAPATGAFAATAPKLNSVKKYLHLDKDGYDEYDFNISGKQKGWTYEWTSANEKVAKVNNLGVVTATGVGSTKVSVYIENKDGKEVDTLDATVVVRDNIAELEIYLQGENQPAVDKLLVGKDYDFGRKYKTVSGSSTKTSGVTRWTVDATADKATIVATSGLFNAKVAGEYKLTARSFQSDEKFKAWEKDNTLEVVTAVKELTVKVNASITDVDQIDKNSIKVTFSSPMDEAQVKANLSLNAIVTQTGSKVKHVIKEIKLANDKMSATVIAYVDFAAKTIYSVDYVGMESGQFTAATMTFDDVVDMQITSLTENVEDPAATPLTVKLFNKDNVDITTSELLGRVTFASSSDRVGFAGNSVTIWQEGVSTQITATYHTYKYDLTTGQETGAIVRTATMVGVKNAPVTLGSLNAWTIVDAAGNDPKFDNVNHSLAVGDAGYRLYVQAKKGDNNINSKDDAKFTFESTDGAKLFVGSNGTLYPVRDGATVVLVKYDGNVLDTVTVTVTGARAANQLKLTHGNLVLSNDPDVTDSAEMKIEVLDQYNQPMNLSDTKVTLYNTQIVDDPIMTNLTGGGTKEAKATFSGTLGGFAAEAGSYTFKVESNGLTRYIVVEVRGASASPSTSYRLNLSGTSFDTKVDANDTTETLTIKIYGYDNNGIANELHAVSGAGYTVEVTGPASNSDIAAAFNTTTGVLSMVSVVSGSPVTKLASGTYKVRLLEGTKVHDIQFFEVKNSQSAPSVTVEKLVSTEKTVDAAIKDCLKLGDKADSDINIGVAGTNYVVLGNGIYIKNILYVEKINGASITHTINVDTSVEFNK